MKSDAQQPGSLVTYRLAALAAVFAAVYAVVWSLPHLHGLVISLAVAAIAWPIWIDQREHAMFERRAVLTGTTLEDSWFRRWFWKGQVTGALRVFSALAWACLLLAFGSLLAWQQWIFAATVVVALALAIGPMNRWLARHVLRDRIGLVARRWPLRWLNIALLTAGFMVLDFALIGAPDTREMTWQAVAEHTFAAKNAGYSWAAAGWLVGTLAAADALVWHTWQVLIPQLADHWLRVTTWMFVLLQAGVFALALTRFQLGVCAVAELASERPRRATGRDSSKIFIATVLFTAVVFGYLAAASVGFDRERWLVPAREVIKWTDPCKLDQSVAAAWKVGFETDLERARVAAALQAGDSVDKKLDELFGNAERGVDAYLDWYFTISAEYQRLGAAAMKGGAARLLEDELHKRLFGGTNFTERLVEASERISSQAAKKFADASADVKARLENRVKAEPCRLAAINLPALANLDRDVIRASAAVAGGVAAGVVVSGAISRAVSTISKTKAFQAAAKIFGKTAVKRAGIILAPAGAAAALCALAGPAAPICVAAVAVGTWLTIDKLGVEIDEALFRDKMRTETLASVGALKDELAHALKLRHHAEIDHMAALARSAVERAFIPARDGI